MFLFHDIVKMDSTRKKKKKRRGNVQMEGQDEKNKSRGGFYLLFGQMIPEKKYVQKPSDNSRQGIL